MKRILYSLCSIFLITLLISSCIKKSDEDVTGKDFRNGNKNITVIENTPTETPTENEETIVITNDNVESYWYVVFEFQDMKGSFVTTQPNSYINLKDVKEEAKKSFNRPNENPFILNFVKVSVETYATFNSK